MSRRCELCGKQPRPGHAVSHSNIKNPRWWMPNLHHARLGSGRRVLVCTRCLRTLRKQA